MLCDDDSLKGMRRVQPDLTQRSGTLPGAPQSRQSAKLFLQSSELGLPQPLTRSLVRPSPDSGGEGERGNEGTYTVVLFIYTYFVGCLISLSFCSSTVLHVGFFFL
jgi:hypothetical protein